jgi:hypothetical protein
MFIWCSLLFLLGVLAFLDSLFNMGEIFRQVNSVLFMLISVGLLIRTTTKAKEGRLENYEKRVFDLEKTVNVLREGQRKLQDY